MDKKPTPYIPLDSLRTQRVEVYINDLQMRLHQLRNKHDTIFIECCDILKKIQEVSSQTITKQQEISRIIQEFEELGLKNSPKDCVLKKVLTQKAGDVKRLREKFEKIFQDNLDALIVRTKCSLEEIHKIHNGEQQSTGEEERDSVYWSTIDSLYSLSNAEPESLCLAEDEIPKAFE